MINKERKIKRIISSFILMVVSIGMLFPFYWMVKTAFTSNNGALQIPPKLFTWPLNWENFVYVVHTEYFMKSIFNSLIISLISTAGVLLTSSMAAFAFAKLKFKRSGLWFALIYGTMLIPSQVLLIPMFVIFSKLHLIDTYVPLILPQVMINGYGVFLLRQFMVSIPDSYIEAAKIDGYSFFGVFWKIILPLSKSSLITLGIFTFVGNWNNFLGALIYLNSEELFTLPLMINAFRTQYYVQWGTLMAASTISVIPMFILYLFAQKQFMEGIAMSGLKG